jgi:DUF4097 and DUF4098 domain-containing protein YvlB
MKRIGIIALLILALALVCAGIGAVAFFAANGGFPTNNPFDRQNISAVIEESKTLEVDPEKILTLKVVDEAGSVSITGADVDTVQITAVKTAFDSSQARADEEVKGVKYTIQQTADTVTLRYEIPDSMNFSNNVNTVDFIVTVPTEVLVDIDGSMGEVSVAGTKGNVDIKNDFGKITVDNVEGALSVETNSGEVEATSIKAGTGEIDLHSDFGPITLENANARDITVDSNSGTITFSEVRATGELTGQTDFGNVVFENGNAGSLHVETSSGTVRLTKIRVTRQIFVKNEFGGIELEQAAAASYDLHTNSGGISAEDVKGKVKAGTDFGNIVIGNAQDVTLDLQTNSGTIEFKGSLGTGPHLVKSDFGAINLTLPGDSKLNVDLSTDFGTIKSDLPITVTLTETSDSSGDEISGSVNGGGDLLTVQTSSGGVTLHTSG